MENFTKSRRRTALSVTKANLDDTVISQLGKRDKKWALMLVNASRQLSKAAQHHLKELLKDEGTSKYSVSNDDNVAHTHCIESDSDGSVVEVCQLAGGNSSRDVDDCDSQGEAVLLALHFIFRLKRNALTWNKFQQTYHDTCLERVSHASALFSHAHTPKRSIHTPQACFFV